MPGTSTTSSSPVPTSRSASVALDSIADVDTDFWFTFGPTPTVRRIIEHIRLIQEVDLSYPIILGSDGRVMDGMHRIARAMLEGHSTIEAVRFEDDPDPDYRDCSPEDLPYSTPPTDVQLRSVIGRTGYRRENVRCVTPLGELTDSMANRSSSPSRPSHSRTPRPRTIGATTMCMWSTRSASRN